MDFVRILKFGFSWFGDKETWKYLFAIFGIMVLSFILAVLVGYAAILLPAAPAVPAGAGGIAVGAVALLIGVAATLAITKFFLQIYAIAMEKEKIKAIKVGWGLAVGYFIMNILRALYIVFSVLNLKYFAILVVGTLLAGAGIFLTAPTGLLGLLLIAFGSIFLAAYAVVLIHNYLRLMFAEVFYLRENISMAAALSKSWNLTEGHTILVFIAMFILVLLRMAAGFALIFLSLFMGLGFMVNIALIALFAILRILVQLITFGVSTYYNVAIFTELSKPK